MSVVGGGQTVRTFDAEAAFGSSLALIKGTGANQVKLPAAANVAIVGISGLAGGPAGTGKDAQKVKPPIITQGEADVTAGGVFAVGDMLRVASVDGTVDEQIVDLAPLGGRDRHFAETPRCQQDCGYRPSVISWTEGR